MSDPTTMTLGGPPEIEVKYRTYALRAFSLKADDDGPGTFEGYASTWERDSGGDVILQGAFADVLPQFLSTGFIDLGHATLSWMGAPDVLPIATPTEAKEDDTGLFIKATFHTTERAQDARRVMAERLDRGLSVGLSIGYLPDREHVRYEDDDEDGIIRIIGKMKELAETSVVMMPMNASAGATVVKSTHTFLAECDALVAGAEHIRTRAQWITDARVKQGRTLSDVNRDRFTRNRDALLAVVSDLDALLVATALPANDITMSRVMSSEHPDLTVGMDVAAALRKIAGAGRAEG